MFHIKETFSAVIAPRVVSIHETFEAAKAELQKLPLVLFEEDADNPGCADAFASTGSLYVIEPAK